MLALIAAMMSVGRLMNPSGETIAGQVLPFAIVTETDQFITTEADEPIVTETSP